MPIAPYTLINKVASTLLLCGLALGSGSCSQAGRTANVQNYTFLVGPRHAPKDGADHRFHVTIPSRYISSLSNEALKTLEVPEFSFPYHFTTGAPATHEELGKDDVVLGTISWAQPGAVKRRLDGSWQNYYLRYSVRGAPEYGLETARGPDKIDTSVLFYAIENGVMIECQSVLGEKLRSCHLYMNSAGFAVVEARFSATLLPRWRELMTKTASIAGLNV